MASAFKSLPSSFRKLIVSKLTPVFKDAVVVVNEPLLKPEFNQVLVRNRYVGINASDINMTAGRYLPGVKPPFSLGFEAVGEVVGLGDSVSDVKLGQPVMYIGNDAFSEYVYLPENKVITIRSAVPEFIPLLVSGATSSLSLDKVGRIVPGEKVLITAAAGGTGHIAVQWAKNSGCHTIGLCSSREKVNVLKEMGCDRPINYKEESIEKVLRTEYPDGIDVVWETVGGKLFDLLLTNLAVKGRMVVVGAISAYKEDSLLTGSQTTDLPFKLLLRSQSVGGFFLNHYMADIPHYLSRLVRLMHEERLKVLVDLGKDSPNGLFQGLEDIGRAVEYLHSGANKGKVVVAL